MSWEERALCASHDPETFFPMTAAEERLAKAICAQCPVRNECLVAALSSSVQFGIWGGMNERERRRVRRRFRGTRDWKELVAAGATP